MFNLNTNNVLRHAARASDAQLNFMSSPEPIRQIDEMDSSVDGRRDETHSALNLLPRQERWPRSSEQFGGAC